MYLTSCRPGFQWSDISLACQIHSDFVEFVVRFLNFCAKIVDGEKEMGDFHEFFLHPLMHH